MKMLLNPWIVAGGLAALIGAFFLGVYMEHGRFMGFVAEVRITGEHAAREAARKAAESKKLLVEKETEHAKNSKSLSAFIDDYRRRLRDARARGSAVPAAPAAAAGGAGVADGRICFDREKLRAGIDGALARFEQRYLDGVQRGAGAMILLNTCAGWAQGAAVGLRAERDQ